VKHVIKLDLSSAGWQSPDPEQLPISNY